MITKRKLVVLSAVLVSFYAFAGTKTVGGSIEALTPANILHFASSSVAPLPKMSPPDAVRLAKQATFGPTPALIADISSIGADRWISDQFAASGSSYIDLAKPLPLNFCKDYACYRVRRTREQVAMRFYRNAVSSPDQLRQRVALALSQLMVTSMIKTDDAAGMSSYQQIFLDGAFGNYRDILAAVSLNGYMGNYLDLANSNKSSPSENYAREMLQLFTMGPFKLNMDGSVLRDGNGLPIENYRPEDIANLARAMTGWTFAHVNNGALTDYYSRDYTNRMVPVSWNYDAGPKIFLENTVPAGATQMTSVNTAIDAAFNNSSTPPHVAKYLIQQLVTSNPSGAYVARVAAAFANNGSNIRGDMKAVIRAILLDPEARGDSASSNRAGKVKEPILLITTIARTLGMSTDGFAFQTWDEPLGQPVFMAPSVFNFYPADYPLHGNPDMASPVSKLLSAGQIAFREKLSFAWTINAVSPRDEFSVKSYIAGSRGTSVDWSYWEAFGSDFDGMIDQMNLLLMNNTMTASQRSALKDNWNAIVNPDPVLQARKRAAALLYVIFSSPQFQVDR